MKHVPGYDPSLEYSHQHPEDPTVGTKRSPEAMSPEMPTKKVVQHVRPSSNKNVSGAGSASDPLKVLSEKKEASYAEREDSGKVIIQYNEELNVSSKPFLYRHNESRDGVQEVVGDKVEAPNVVVTPAISDEILETMSSISEQATQNTNITQQKKFLYSRLADRAEGIEYRLADFEQGAEVDEKQYDTTVFGRVCCNAEGGVGKLNSTSVELELSRNTGISKRIELNLQALSNVMLFPGQVIAAQGARESSTKLHVSNIVTSARLPLPRSPGSLLEKERRTREVDEQTTVPVRGGGPLRVWIAGGQFTLDNDLEFKPLLDLFQEVMAHPPDVLILMGPFLPESHPMIRQGNAYRHFKEKDYVHSFQDLFTKKFWKNVTGLLKKVSHLRVVMVPSVDDVLSLPILPSAPFDHGTTDAQRIHVLSNPSTFTIGDAASKLVFGGISTDVLFDIRRERFAKGDKEFMSNTNKLETAVDDLLDQRSYYPLYPGNPDTPLDMSLAEHLRMPMSPDILFVRSRLRPFISNRNGTLAINTGKLATMNRGGTFAKLYINPIDTNSVVDEDGSFQHNVAERTKAEIVCI
eukprot:gb/GECG01011593.1/.p1 GENE.gb/GECG01011593.1/~~gb/GECG01011593.1/.p1  ORF type:complete len:579 (+),score=75.78 gb/GECG01011593.1/:1-1737(+)